jgi:hypothetical protein
MTFCIFARFFTPIKGETTNKRSSIQTKQLQFDLNSQKQSITLKEVIQKLNINFNDYTFAKGTTFLSLDSTLNNEDYINIFSK